jgi:hypothetical protein
MVAASSGWLGSSGYNSVIVENGGSAGQNSANSDCSITLMSWSQGS